MNRSPFCAVARVGAALPFFADARLRPALRHSLTLPQRRIPK